EPRLKGSLHRSNEVIVHVFELGAPPKTVAILLVITGKKALKHGAQRCGATRGQSTTQIPSDYQARQVSCSTMTDPPLPRRYQGTPGFDVSEPPPWHKPTPNHRALIDNHEFLADCSRYLEGLYTRQQVKKRWRNIDDATWDRLGDDNELVDAIELERTR